MRTWIRRSSSMESVHLPPSRGWSSTDGIQRETACAGEGTGCGIKSTMPSTFATFGKLPNSYKLHSAHLCHIDLKPTSRSPQKEVMLTAAQRLVHNQPLVHVNCLHYCYCYCWWGRKKHSPETLGLALAEGRLLLNTPEALHCSLQRHQKTNACALARARGKANPRLSNALIPFVSMKSLSGFTTQKKNLLDTVQAHKVWILSFFDS